ncbi:VRR-NUC domain-containing protein [Paenibacillus sp. PR3]|uniref:VRR-NUC domain-containing protein n=1 Tax=Paenibacillus terricola TaxID=2763503 RepID=A0ABR8MQQ0_9BACL|nr:VRR-NUC domain-containing protein [Paenibacillus terricola]MBD3917626.1 VRR-NUC domain-containing protein [Paenibacillus terricola]
MRASERNSGRSTEQSVLELRLVQEVERLGGMAPRWLGEHNRAAPARIVIFPGECTLYVVMKTPGCKCDTAQLRWVKRLLGPRCRHYIIDSNEGIDRFIRDVSVGGLHKNR